MTRSESTSSADTANLHERPTVYRPTVRYRFYAVAGGIIALLFGWDLLGVLRQPLALSALLERLLFLLVGLGLLGWSIYTALGRVVLTKESIILHAPLRPPITVQFRQLISVTEAGRFGRSLALLYHPLQPNGLLDLDDARSLFMPSLGEQQALLTQLQEKTPT